MRRPGVSAVILFAALAFCACVTTAAACSTALILAIDVSNSIDDGEYAIQAEGLADALRDPQIAEELIRGKVSLSVIQWSGKGRQVVSIPWARMRTAGDVRVFAERARSMPRAFVMSDTAVGDLIRFALPRYSQVPDCARKTLDISGDGSDNAGTDPQGARRMAEAQGVTINALAIEGIGIAITSFYRGQVITKNGFVLTAQGHGSYADTLREKILREVSAALF